MIKTLISISILSGLIALLMSYTEILYFLLIIKGTVIYYLSYWISSLAIFVAFFELAWVIVVGFLKKI